MTSGPVALIIVGLALSAVTFGAEAQPAPRLARVGVLAGGGSGFQAGFEPFRQRLGELGYVEGQTMEVAPRASRLAVLWDPRNVAQASMWREIQEAGRALKVTPLTWEVRGPDEIERVNRKTAKALSLTIPPSLLVRADEIIE